MVSPIYPPERSWMVQTFSSVYKAFSCLQEIRCTIHKGQTGRDRERESERKTWAISSKRCYFPLNLKLIKINVSSFNRSEGFWFIILAFPSDVRILSRFVRWLLSSLTLFHSFNVLCLPSYAVLICMNTCQPLMSDSLRINTIFALRANIKLLTPIFAVNENKNQSDASNVVQSN